MKFMKTIAYGLTMMLLLPLIGTTCYGNEPETSSAEFYPTGKEPPPLKQKNAKPERLFQSPCMNRANLFDYAIQMTIDTDMDLHDNSSGKSSDGSWSSSSSSGSIRYIPRISITAKNNPLQSCLLVIEYFSHETMSKSKSRKECVEHISLPDIDKGTSMTVDANGVKFHKWEQKSSSSSGYKYKRGGGLELHGVIVSFYKDDKLLIQMCMPQSLNKECTDSVPAPQAYENSTSRRYDGW